MIRLQVLKRRLVLGILLFASTAWPQEPPKLRLDGNVRPKEYSAALRIVPGEDSYLGVIDIDVEVRQPTRLIWLNATSLKLTEASLDGNMATIVPGNSDFQGLAFQRVAHSGRLHISYTGVISRKDASGVFQMKDADEWYVYTQFESIAARRAFPCFDEPAYKVPWQLTLEVKKDHLALSNTPVMSEIAGTDGMKTVRFEKTKPLPSYLVAFAVGPFETAPGRPAGAGKTPVRIIVPRGRKAEAEYAAKTTPEIIERLEKYFGIPYPYQKLDSIAVPLFGGAMENAGLVTYDLDTLLSKPTEDTIQRQRSYVRVAAHELGHQWFGDMVTLAWWDDVWLNEAFATWVANRMVDEWEPTWGSREEAVASRLRAMQEDSLVSARKVRQPIESNSDIASAFDQITYEKGAAIILMFESWLGPEKFRQGVKNYLEQHAFGNTNAADFEEAIGRAARQDVARQFSTFLDQPGVPVISIALKCGNGRAPELALSQKRLLPKGSKGVASQTWNIPVCVAYEAGTKRRRECTLLALPTAEWKLAEANACPAWVMGNADGSGYYHVRYEEDLLERVLAGAGQHLSLPERISTLGDVAALSKAGEASATQGLKLVRDFSADSNRHIVASTISIVEDVRGFLVPEDLRPNYARFIERMYGERAVRLGWQSRLGDDADTRILRPQLLGLVARDGHDPTLNAEARRLARQWLTDRKAVEPDMVYAVLVAAARHGDEALFDDFLKAARGNKDSKERRQLLTALGSFRQPVLTKRAFGLLFDSDFDPRESLALLFRPVDQPETRELPYQFVKENYDALVAKLPKFGDFDVAAFLLFAATGFCSADRIGEVKAFFEERMKIHEGGAHNLAETLETIELCDANVRAQQAGVQEFLKEF